MTLPLNEALQNLQNALTDVLESARSDDKTPLKNALALSESKSRFASSKDNYIIVFGDINRFKRINTTFGYDAGDAAIYQVGTVVQNLFVEKLNAEAFRKSGDEFVVLLKSTFLDEFISSAKNFSSCEVKFQTETFPVGVSFGYAISDGKSDFETLQAKAETACKVAKRKGNRIVIGWSSDMEQTALESFRDNCSKCGSVTSCDIPSALNLSNIKFCGACGIAFDQ